LIDISIISGTYNRFSSLQQMIASARASLGTFHYGLSYEFVLVDGNSQDGTQAWIESQSDCRLIRHQTLLGAVRAFNDGAFAARGDYVILANDDIEFVDDSIFRAWLFMQLHPDCGIGCFFQDRNNRGWHVETMPAVRNGKQDRSIYGNVCIIPKWLGDSVGWWGNYLHTYGGDNELSSRVLELGFQILPIGTEDNPLAKIHDNEIADDLRKINNESRPKIRGHNPDSWAWGQKWKDKHGLVGAVVRDKPLVPNSTSIRERILYLPVFEPGFPVLKEQKRGLREALAELGLVVEYDYVGKFRELSKDGMLTELANWIATIQPTMIFTQLHSGNEINYHDIAFWKRLAPQAVFVNWNGDYWPDNLLSEEGVKLAKVFDFFGSVNLDAVEKLRLMGAKAHYWQIGFEPDGVGHKAEAHHDIIFLATGYSKTRQQFGRWLQRLNGPSLGVYGAGWPKEMTKGNTLYNFKEGCKLYQGAKISLGDSQWPESGFVSNRVFQALAAGGAALAHQWFRGMEDLGLKDGDTCIIWRTYPDLEKKLRYYLAKDEERKQIAERGQQLAFERHSFKARVQELMGILKGQPEKAIKEVENWRW